MGLFSSFTHILHDIKHGTKIAGTGLFKGVVKPSYKAVVKPAYKAVVKPAYTEALRPVAVATFNEVKHYGGKAQDFADANIDTAIGFQKALTRTTQSVAEAGEGLGNFLQNGLSWYLVLGGGAIVALVVLTRS